MLSWIGKVLGTDKGLEVGVKIIDKSVGGIISGIDAAFYTSEEKAHDIKEMIFKLQDQFTPRAISRRILAIMFTVVFLGIVTTAVIFACFGKTTTVKDIILVAEAFQMGWIMLSIIAFYFGYYGWQQIKGVKK